ncbi:unnamed protein product [Linum tenue]|uniref:RNase H type-1 domain-containing protein n=2 Tax=Linum tenue TaxID=586396 RepID=A0AAV0QY82_9ROSI|nr:unnamed protein product [Linum tenue]
MAAFAMNLRICSITRAELRGAVEGLQLAWDMGYSHVRMELDSRCAIHLIQGEDTSDHQHAAVIDRFHELLRRDWDVTVSHIYREGNKNTDFLASRGHQLYIGFHFVPVTDPALWFYLLYDIEGVSESRLVLNEG